MARFVLRVNLGDNSAALVARRSRTPLGSGSRASHGRPF